MASSCLTHGTKHRELVRYAGFDYVRIEQLLGQGEDRQTVLLEPADNRLWGRTAAPLTRRKTALAT